MLFFKCVICAYLAAAASTTPSLPQGPAVICLIDHARVIYTGGTLSAFFHNSFLVNWETEVSVYTQ